ncbi:hypothetical protein P3738_25295, partial [Vibrio parahaemolyticus]|uniref:hypothetical protein n=1 Tax=Vibrio parahaemolyticus TaxID=670 RepID=UPI0020160665
NHATFSSTNLALRIEDQLEVAEKMFDANIARAHSEKQKWCVIYNTELTSILSITINISKVMTTIPNGSRHRFRLLREHQKNK